MSKNDYNDVDALIFGGGGAPSVSWKYAEVGDEFDFEITDKPSKLHEKDDDGELKNWKDGNPVEQIVLPVSTNLRNWKLVSRRAAEDRADETDNGDRRIYVKAWGTQLKALREALKAANVKTVAVGGKGTMKLVSRTRNENPTYSDTNNFAFTYVPPKEELNVAKDEPAVEDSSAVDNEKAQQIAKLKAAGIPDDVIASMVAAGTL